LRKIADFCIGNSTIAFGFFTLFFPVLFKKSASEIFAFLSIILIALQAEMIDDFKKH
jgi:uncharacterized membrane protein YczE